MKKFLKRAGIGSLIVFVLINIAFIWQAFIFTHFSEAKVAKEQHSNFLQQKFNRFFGSKHPRQFVVDSLTVPHDSLHINSDGLKLAAWHLKHGGDTAKGTVIMFHGFGSSRSDIIPEATAFYKMQYNVFMIDFRAHGLSEGSVCSMGYFESDDVRSAYNYIKNTGERNIILWGGSMGAASIIKAMYDDNNIKPSKVILEKSYGKMTDAVEGLVRNSMHEPAEPLATMLTFWGSAEQGIWLYGLKPEDYACKITCPALIQWGSKDEQVSRQETQTLYHNLGSSRKKLVIYPGARHENLLLHNPSLWQSSISSFLNTSAMTQSPVNKKEDHNSSETTTTPSVSSVSGN
jgi:alpha-beta hydrolase superfamily lysophospholipase